MIQDYDDIMAQWCYSGTMCSGTMTVTPEEDLTRWAVQQTITVLANADYYYTRTEVDNLLSQVTGGGLTKAEVEQMIAYAIESKADKSEVQTLAEKVRENTNKLLNVYTKTETNSLLQDYLTRLEAMRIRDNYSKVENNTLTLNSEYGISI